MKCKAEGCQKEAKYKSPCLCATHYSRQWRHRSTHGDALDKVWEEAWKSARADREEKDRCLEAMRRAGACANV